MKILPGADPAAVAPFFRELLETALVVHGVCPLCRAPHLFVFVPPDHCVYPVDEALVGSRPGDANAARAVRSLMRFVPGR